MLSSTIRAQIPGLKDKYGAIYLLDVSEFLIGKELGSELLIRAMTRAEFNSFTSSFLIDPVRAVQNLLHTHCICPDLDNYKAGIDEYVCTAISKVSGFASEESLGEQVEQGRNYARSLEAAITIYICKAFPKFGPDDVDNMTLEDQMRYVALAEQMIGKELPYMEFLNPTRPKKKKSPVPRHLLEPPEGKYQNSFVQEQPTKKESVDKHVIVTPENLFDVMKETREIFNGRPQ